jgi:hypothetical protein
MGVRPLSSPTRSTVTLTYRLESEHTPCFMGIAASTLSHYLTDVLGMKWPMEIYARHIDIVTKSPTHGVSETNPPRPGHDLALRGILTHR